MAPRSITFNQPGAIVKARLRNFMTYNDTTLTPGTNLNMVIGPNGSGKSAIVCSIIVGLAGDVTLTGRAASIIDLVQKGSKWGSTEIELYNDKGRNYVVERKITLQTGAGGKLEHKNEWRLNGATVLKRDIQALMTKLNIKVDNLCQFLPQDSVASFVKMTPGDLLVKTLKAAGSNELVEDLERLTTLTQDITTKTLQLASLKQASAENEVNARRLETEVEELRAREQLVKQKVICALKIYYIRYKEALNRCDTAKDSLQDHEERLRQAKSEGDPFQQKIKFYKTEEAKLHELVSQGAENSRKVQELVQRSKENLEQRKLSIQEVYADYKKKREQEKQRDQQIRLKQQELVDYECRLMEIREVDYTKQIQAIKNDMDKVRTNLMDNRTNQDNIRRELSNLISQSEEIKRTRVGLQRIREQKLSFMASKKKESGRVSEWLFKNRDVFEKPVLQPIMCEVNVSNQKDAPLIEHVLSESDFFSFVCQTERDLRKLTEVARRDLSSRINTIMAPERSLEEFERQPKHLDFTRFRGFRGFLKDLIDAPEPVMRYLCGQYHFHRVPVFNDLPEANLKLVMESGCPRFFVRDKCYQAGRSRYDNSTTTFTSNVNSNPRFLKHSLDKRQLDELNRQLEALQERKKTLDEKSVQLNHEKAEADRSFNELRARHMELSQKQGEKARIEELIKMVRGRIESLKTEVIDMQAETSKFHESVKKLNRKMIEDLDRLGRAVAHFVEIRESYCLNTLKRSLARRNHRIAERRYKETMQATETLQKEIHDMKKEMNALEAAVRVAKANAEEKIKGFKNDRLDKATKAKFASVEQDTVEQLELYEEELKARIQGMGRDTSNQVMDEFNRQNQELLDKRRQIASLEATLKKNDEEVQEIKARFLPLLDDVINVIDEHYRDFMRKLNYDGRVMLGRDTENLDDFSKYGIDIMVKYRDNEQLIPLSSTRQSGGERSVATMIYMLALQTKTTVPFRVVDEINQGMDKENERKVFELLVRVADESSSQYFLVSPKLLSGLNYGERMQIHIVFNGPQLEFCFDQLKAAAVNGNGDEAYESDESSEVYYDTQ